MKPADDYRIHLNFLPIAGELPQFQIYRKLRGDPQEHRPSGDDIHYYSLPKTRADTEDRASYWVSFESKPDFEPFSVEPSFNRHLTIWALFSAIAKQCTEKLEAEDYWLLAGGFWREVHFNMRSHKQGVEQLIIQPYQLRALGKFGIVADFHFRKNPDVPFSREVQRLSLSLDDRFRRNLDIYVDSVDKIEDFLKERQDVLASIPLPGASQPVRFEKEFAALPATRLRPRSYMFNNDREARSQFMGLQQHGPLQALSHSPNLVFIFREQDRQAARTLAAAIKGSSQRERFSFPGFERLFKGPIEINREPVVLADFSANSMKSALERIQSERNGKISMPVLILPDDEDEGYFNHKALFTHAGIPSQACTLGVIQDENTLKWSVGNIALQIFCKAGGLPWKVRPTAERSLIIGISQSHKVRKTDERIEVEKYFAFSILTDSSGLFEKIQVLGQGDDQETYLAQLRKSLREILAGAATEYSRVVVHTSFKLKRDEMDEIEKLVKEAAAEKRDGKCQFAVVKVNHKRRFFGANRRVNSLVPFEGSRVKLGSGEYLVWFEGIFPDKPTVTKPFPGPTHLQFLRITEDRNISDEILLQDLVNLSGANWRGFNAKSAPVSVFYCHLVADLVHDFQERDLPLPAVEGLKPWFL
jgi:Piwi domain